MEVKFTNHLTKKKKCKKKSDTKKKVYLTKIYKSESKYHLK